jgi:single-strand DNA-binding protein
MHNLVYLIGRIVKDPEVKELESGKSVVNATIAVQRSYKNADGVYETDFVDCTMWDSMARNVAEYCKKGDLVGIKGRLQVNTYEVDGEKRKSTDVICEKVTFLAAKKEKAEETEVTNDEQDIDM